MKSKSVLMALGLILVLFSYSFAQVPQMINYQGKLTKSSGASLDTTIQMIFSIYADSNGSVLKWTETQGSVKVDKGVFNVLLGSVNLIPDTVFDGNIRYLGVKVGGDPEITPRKPMVSVPYAYRTATGVGDNDWTINGDTIYHLNGYVGIGTTAPSSLLHLGGLTGGGLTIGNAGYVEPNNNHITFSNSDTSPPGFLGHSRMDFEMSTNTRRGTSQIWQVPFDATKNSWNLRFGIAPLSAEEGFHIDHAPATAGTPVFVNYFTITEAGNIGIGTTSPGNILTVVQNSSTDPIADAWTTYSSREYKRDIHELTPEEYRNALEKLLNVPVVKFRYKGEDTKEKIGVIAEDAPEEILAEGDNKAISLNEYISLLHAALKAQQEEIEALKSKLEKIETNR